MFQQPWRFVEKSGGIKLLKLKDSGQFKKDYKKCVKRGLNMELLKAVVSTLAIPETLEAKNKDHKVLIIQKRHRAKLG